jgi:hypothetical protein
MTLEEWKVLFAEKVELAEEAYRRIFGVLDEIENIEGEFDADELAALIHIKFKRVQDRMQKFAKEQK